MFGRERDHTKLGTPGQMRLATWAAVGLACLGMAVLVSILLAAVRS
jgi:hypothetical protein